MTARKIETASTRPESVTPERLGFSVKEVSAQSSLSKAYLRNKIRDGELVVTRFGRRVVILSEDLDKFLRLGSK